MLGKPTRRLQRFEEAEKQDRSCGKFSLAARPNRRATKSLRISQKLPREQQKRELRLKKSKDRGSKTSRTSSNRNCHAHNPSVCSGFALHPNERDPLGAPRKTRHRSNPCHLPATQPPIMATKAKAPQPGTSMRQRSARHCQTASCKPGSYET